MFSLARGGYAPASPWPACPRAALPSRLSWPRPPDSVWRSPSSLSFPESAYVYLFGVSLFGGLFAWLMIFITHLYFRPAGNALGRPRLPVRMIGYPYTSWLGIIAIVAIMVTTWWVEGMRVTLEAGLPWLVVLTIAYLIVARRRTRLAAVAGHSTTGPAIPTTDEIG